MTPVIRTPLDASKAPFYDAAMACVGLHRGPEGDDPVSFSQRSPLPAFLLLAALGLAVAGLAVAAEQVSLSGRIFQPDGATPYANAIVRIINQETGEALVSAPTDAAGRYEFKDLPPGTYSFEVEVPEGIYRLDRQVALGENDTASISFTVKPEEDDHGEAAPAHSGPGMSPRRKGTLIALIGGGAALLVGLSTNDSDGGEASPFTPSD